MFGFGKKKYIDALEYEMLQDFKNSVQEHLEEKEENIRRFEVLKSEKRKLVLSNNLSTRLSSLDVDTLCDLTSRALIIIPNEIRTLTWTKNSSNKDIIILMVNELSDAMHNLHSNYVRRNLQSLSSELSIVANSLDICIDASSLLLMEGLPFDGVFSKFTELRDAILSSVELENCTQPE